MKDVMVIMGSSSDWPIMQKATKILQEFGVDFETQVVSAHRMAKDLQAFVTQCEKESVRLIIAGAGGAAHLPGMVAAFGTLPVIGVPIKTAQLEGVDSLYSIVQMPRGVPVATVGINNAENAAYLALRILALNNHDLSERLIDFNEQERERARAMTQELS